MSATTAAWSRCGSAVRSDVARRVLPRLLLAACAVACITCEAVAFLDLCDPKGGGGRVGFYSAGDCLGTNLTVFRGHEWITFLGNRDPDAPGGQHFTADQIAVVIEGNRHRDYPKELLVYLDTGPVAYLDALFAYHGAADGQPEHFILRPDNTYEEALEESLELLRSLTHEAAGHWPDRAVESLTALGKATHLLQDSYSPAHSVRVPEPPAPDVPWCFCKLKTYVPRAPGYDTPDIEFHDRLDERADDRGKVHTTALDSIYFSERFISDESGRSYDCLDPKDARTVEQCMKPEAQRAKLSTREYLRIARKMFVTGADTATIDAELDTYFATHYTLCAPRVPLPSGNNCDRHVATQP